MPHLSPMSWLLAISMFWFFLWMLSSKSWWSKLTLMPFNIKSKQSSSMKTPQWKWN